MLVKLVVIGLVAEVIFGAVTAGVKRSDEHHPGPPDIQTHRLPPATDRASCAVPQNQAGRERSAVHPPRMTAPGYPRDRVTSATNNRGSDVPNVEFKRKAQLSRQEAADRLIALGNALASGSEIELSTGDDTLKLGVAGRVNWELEIEIDGDETELEIEIKWTDDASRDAQPAAAELTSDPATAPEKPAPARRGRPRKVATA